MIPEFLLIVVLRVNLRIKQFHNPYDGLCLLASLLPVGNGLDLFNHIQDNPPVLRHLKLLSLRVVVELYRVVNCVHK